MGRRKKENVEITQTQEQNQEQPKKEIVVKVQDKSSSTVSYSGSVQIQLKRDGKLVRSHIVKNKGYKDLFNYLAYALSGQLNNALFPRVLYCFYNDGEGENTKASNFIVFADVEAVEDNDTHLYSTVFTFTIGYNAIILPEGAINRLVLTNSKNIKTLSQLTTVSDERLEELSCAIIDLDENNLIRIEQLDVNTSVIVLWNMSIKNETVPNQNQ